MSLVHLHFFILKQYACWQSEIIVVCCKAQGKKKLAGIIRIRDGSLEKQCRCKLNIYIYFSPICLALWRFDIRLLLLFQTFFRANKFFKINFLAAVKEKWYMAKPRIALLANLHFIWSIFKRIFFLGLVKSFINFLSTYECNFQVRKFF